MRSLSARIAADLRLAAVTSLGRTLLTTGLRAGDGYPEVWIRDTNTFIEAALPLNRPTAMRDALTNFFLLQGPEGDIVDGYLPRNIPRTAAYRTSPKLPELAAFKNTVESDQESSLVSAVCKYVSITGDRAFLTELIEGKTVLERLGFALDYVLLCRWDSPRGLVWAGATIDWGDVAPEDPIGDQIDTQSHPACSIYANAMFAIAITDYLTLLGVTHPDRPRWQATRRKLTASVRAHLWDTQRSKYRTHLYLKSSPFPADFDENAIYYLGGTAIAIEAGFLTQPEIRASLDLMRQAIEHAHAGSIGLTVYPPYPKDFFRNPIVAEPYTYQNGGDWDWFGARMVQQLIAHNLVEDAYREFSPMVDRILAHGGFYEWWTRDNQPRGSASFRGSAGVMLKTIAMFSRWAKVHA